MKTQEICHCCGNTVTAYTLPFNKFLLDAFVNFAEQFLIDKKPRKKAEMNLTNPQYTNWHNLRHFNIILQDEETHGWILTRFGEQFYRGKVPVMIPAAHMGGRTLCSTHPAWLTHDKPRQRIFIWELLETAEWKWKQREEYQEEKSQQTLFSS